MALVFSSRVAFFIFSFDFARTFPVPLTLFFFPPPILTIYSCYTLLLFLWSCVKSGGRLRSSFSFASHCEQKPHKIDRSIDRLKKKHERERHKQKREEKAKKKKKKLVRLCCVLWPFSQSRRRRRAGERRLNLNREKKNHPLPQHTHTHFFFFFFQEPFAKARRKKKGKTRPPVWW